MIGDIERLSINLPKQLMADVRAMAVDGDRSITDVVRRAIGLLQATEDAMAKGKELHLVDPATPDRPTVVHML